MNYFGSKNELLGNYELCFENMNFASKKVEQDSLHPLCRVARGEVDLLKLDQGGSHQCVINGKDERGQVIGCIEIYTNERPIGDEHIKTLQALSTPILLLSHTFFNMHHGHKAHFDKKSTVLEHFSTSTGVPKITSVKSPEKSDACHDVLNDNIKRLIFDKMHDHVHQLCLCERAFLYSKLEDQTTLKLEFHSGHLSH